MKTKKEPFVSIKVPKHIKGFLQNHRVGDESLGSALDRILKQKKVLK